LSVEEVDELDFKQWIELYQSYKDDFDFELCLTKRGMTYAEAYASQQANHGAENTISW